MRLPLTIALAATLAACASSPPPADNPPTPDDTEPTVQPVPEAFLTPLTHTDEIDSLAVWAGADGRAWLIATAKNSHQLVVYDGDSGARLREVGGPGPALGQFNRPNGIAVFGDWLFVVERDNHRVQVLHLPEFAPRASFGDAELTSPYGLWLQETAPHELEVLVTDSYLADVKTLRVPPLAELDRRVKRYRVALDGDAPRAQLLGSFGDTSAGGALRMVESIAGDPAHDRLLIAEEDTRVGTTLREYTLAGRYTGRSLPPERFRAQAEGVALWACADGSGYWLTADQYGDRTRFHVFERRDLAFVGSFAGDTVAGTDGVALFAAGTRRFPDGVFYAAHDDQGAAAFDWRDIARVLGLKTRCGD